MQIDGRPGKLVRNRIPEIIRADGGSPEVVELSKHLLVEALRAKLAEEVSELLESPTAEEFADVYEVLEALAHTMHLLPIDIRTAQARKTAERGSFYKGLFLFDPPGAGVSRTAYRDGERELDTFEGDPLSDI